MTGAWPFVLRHAALRLRATPLCGAGCGVLGTIGVVAVFVVPVWGPAWFLSPAYAAVAAAAVLGWGAPAALSARRRAQLDGAVHGGWRTVGDALAIAVTMAALAAVTLPPRTWGAALVGG